MDLGRIASMEKDHKPVDTAKKGDTVAMRIEVRACTACLPALPACTLHCVSVLPACTACLHCTGSFLAAGQRAVCALLKACHWRRPATPCRLLRTPTHYTTHVPCPLQSTKPEEASRSYERHFDHRDELVSRIT